MQFIRYDGGRRRLTWQATLLVAPVIIAILSALMLLSAIFIVHPLWEAYPNLTGPLLDHIPPTNPKGKEQATVAIQIFLSAFIAWLIWISIFATWWARRRLGSSIGVAAEIAGRGKAAVVGLGFAALGALLLLVSIPPLMRAGFSGDAIIPLAGTALGTYWLLARGLGPIWNAVTWSQIRTDTHGEARIATEDELHRAELMPRRDGVYLGQFLNGGAATGDVGYPGGSHLITIGPAGAGKGTGVIVPNLATLRRSILIIDPKGEAAAITARKRAAFGPVIVINPFNVLANQLPYLRSNGFNPLAELDPTHDNFTDDCAGMGQALVKEELGGNAAFFSGSAQDLVSALIMHEKVTRGRDASLANVRHMLTEPYGRDPSGEPVGLLKTIHEMMVSPCRPLRSKSSRFDRESNSTRDIISTAANETRFLDSPPLQRDLEGGAIDWDSMKAEITTVYVILPADRLETHANYLRLVVTSALRTLLRSPPGLALPPVLFMLDEFAQLGYLPPIESAMGIARGFGVQLWPFVQDFNQLHALYRDRWETFIGNAAALTAFAPRDVFTAQYLSQKCGNKTVIVESENERMGATGMGRSRGPQGVPLFRPEALMAMPARQMLCFIDPVRNPLMTLASPYWETPFAHGLDGNPYRPA